MADERPKGKTPSKDDRTSDASPQDTAEAKRLEARRRFLLGGAAALPLIVIVRAANADPEGSISFCISLTGRPASDHKLGDAGESLFECLDDD